MKTTCTLQVFGIELQYLPEWRIIPDNAYSLNFDSGMIRFEENTAERKSRISLGLRWECSETDNAAFLQEFSGNIEEEYRKAVKGKGRQFEILRNDEVSNAQGIPMRLIETRYKATQSLIGHRGNLQRIHACNAAFYCEKTHRLVAASLVTTPAYMEEHQEDLISLLLSLRTHPVYPVTKETARMEHRASLRREAQTRRSPLAGLLRRKAIQ